MKAFCYLRVSGLSQDQGDGPDRQLAAIRSYAESHGIELAEIYQETISGATEREDRPEFSRLREAMLASDIKLVMVEKLDRLARDVLIQESIIKDFQIHNLNIVSTMEPDLSSTDPTRKLIRIILGAFAGYERELISYRMNSARCRLRDKQLILEGKPPFGYRKIKPKGQAHYFEPDPVEYPVRERAVVLYGSLKSFQKAADYLNREGCKTRSGGLWYAPSVRRVVTLEMTNG